ncbi:hypothetical protein QFC21_003254 [Naganishia friedmannii]|uniref:Uncharacterized protein n=1 Tax=Naganishia friedmannii TaxID=89922 RepID=A0ACC2VQX0_9TREE|nr:hypothetical protein QFC21_003254 [Naganishia friedmannii]
MSASQTKAQASYHPAGYGMSPSLKRARKPFLTRNLLTGGIIASFALGTFWYSIAAVQQDDFADVQDLLPPASERGKMLTIEEELEEKRRNNPFAQNLSNNDLSLSSSPTNNASRTSSILEPAGSKIETVTEALKNASPVSPLAPQQQSVRGQSQSPFMIMGGQQTDTASRSRTQEEEQFAMFRLPFFRGRTPHNSGGKVLPIVNGEVNVDNIGSIWDDGVKTYGDRRLV